jgi:S-(hydroxymethyl)glutathione dehydrogenase/alcohol dehydrogenase
MGAVLNNAKLKAGDSIVVFGVGGIGQSAILAAAIVKARIVIAVDINEEKLASAKELGATHTVNAKRTDALATIKEITNGNGVDYAIESAGLVETMEPAFKAVREFGGKAILIGNLFHGQLISIDPFALICGKQIVGSWGGETEPDRDFPKYVELYLSGKLKLDQLITHRFKLEEINEAFSIMEIGKLGRGIIEF